MKLFKVMSAIFALALIASIATLTLAPRPGVASVSAASPRSGELHVTKDCSAYTGLAGSFCTITSSNLAAIAVGSKVVYARAADFDALLVNTNIVLDAGSGNTAVGHCRIDLATALGQCTFSGGTGELTGFHARVAVSLDSSGVWHWDGTYFFSP